jgi:hypothetical protein
MEILLLHNFFLRFCMHLKFTLSLSRMCNNPSHHVLQILKNCKTNSWACSGTYEIMENKSDDVPMSWIFHNTPLLLPMGSVLLYPYAMQMLDTCLLDDLLSYM